MAKGKGPNSNRKKKNPISKKPVGQTRRRLREKLTAKQIESPYSRRSAVLENSILPKQERVTDNPNPRLPVMPTSFDHQSSNVKLTAMASSSACQSVKIEQNKFFPSCGSRQSQNEYLQQNSIQNNLTDTDYPPPDDKSVEKCTESISKFLATSMLPYSLVEEESFKEMVKALNPCYCMPQRKYFSGTAIPKLYTEAVGKLKEILTKDVSAETYFSITCDSWTSVAGHVYMAISVHYVNATWDLVSACLDCVYFEENYTAQDVKNAIKNKLVEWGLNHSFIVACTTDNSANIVNGMMLLNINHVHCLAHSLAKGVNRAIEILAVKNAVGSLESLQNTIAHSWEMKRDFKEAQVLLEYDVKKIPSAGSSKWLSTMKLCKRFLENRTPIYRMLQNFPDKTMPNTSEISTLEKFFRVTSVLQVIIDKLSNENYVAISTMLPTIRQIKTALRIEMEDEILFSNIKDKILNALTCYETEPVQTILHYSTFVDPRFKLSFFYENIKHLVKEAVISEVEALYNSSESDISKSTLPEERTGLSAVFEEEKYQNTTNSKDRALSEVQEYISIPKVRMDVDPLQWWHQYAQRFPKLCIIAKKYLCIQGSSVPSERVFSTRENAVDKIRCSISPKTTEMQVFLAYNKKILRI